MKPTIKKITVTPALAAELLENNDGNRRIVKARVDYLSTEIREGRWNADSNDMICIGTTGRLLNGQHRLSAIVAAETPVEITIQYNTPESAFSIMDTGTKRNATNYFDWCGIPNAHNLPSIVAKVTAWIEFGMPVSTKGITPSAQVLVDRYNEYPQRYQTAHNFGAHLQAIATLSVVASTAWMILNNGHPTDDVRQFFTEASPSYNGAASEGNPARALCATLTRARLQGVKRPDRHTSALIIKAWNAWVDGNKVGQLKWIEGEAFPTIR